MAVDPESFDESNLSRQSLCSMGFLGRPKVEAAAAIETAEIRKLILGLKPGLADKILSFDLLSMEAVVFPLG